MISPLWIATLIFAIVAVITGFMWAYGVQVNATQILVVSLLFIGVVVFAVILKFLPSANLRRSSSDEMKYAEQIARKFWKDLRGEDLDYREAHGVRRPYSNTGIAWGFKFNRTDNSDKPGEPVIIIVGKDAKSPFKSADVLRWNDHPSHEEQEDPFQIFSAGYIGAPFPGMTPEHDAAFAGYRYGGRIGTNISITPKTGEEDFFSGRKREPESGS